MAGIISGAGLGWQGYNNPRNDSNSAYGYGSNRFGDIGLDFWATAHGGDNLGSLINDFTNSAKDQVLADRAYTAMREDTAIQRRVADIQKAGLNPYLAIGGGLGEAASSASTVGSETNAAVQMAVSALGVLGQYASLPSKNLNNLANAIYKIMKAINPFHIGS